MSNEPPVGVFVATATPPEQIPAVASSAERLGYSEVWVAEDYFCYGGFTGAALALGATERIKVGLGVTASTPRHPAVTAMETATLARTYPGRFLPGIGHGVPFWMDQMGVRAKSPLTALTECIDGIRRLLAGETLDLEGGEFSFRSITAAHPPEQEVPLLTGVIGPKSLRLSGRIADGTVMSVLTGTAYLDNATKQIHEGMAEGARTNHQIPTLEIFSVNRDRKKARQAAREAVAHYIFTVLGPNPITDAFGYNEQINEILEKEPTRAIEAMPEEWVDTLAVAGDPDDVAARITELRSAGATSVVLSPVNADTAQDELELTSSAVLPQL